MLKISVREQFELDPSKKDAILKRFVKKHRKLVALKPRIEIDEYSYALHATKNGPQKIEIHVWHPFIFDNRLIPKSFEGMKVLNIIISDTIPYQGQKQERPLPLWEYEEKIGYEKFVEANLVKIQKKLHSPTLSKEEALDCLTVTGNYKKHKRECLSEKHWCIKKYRNGKIYEDYERKWIAHFPLRKIVFFQAGKEIKEYICLNF